MKKRVLTVGVVLVLVFGLAGIAAASLDFGVYRDKTLANLSQDQFGFKGPVANSSTKQVTQQQALADPHSLFTLAKGLSARIVTTSAGGDADQMAFYPNPNHAKYLIFCNEESTTDPGLQRVNI